MFRGSFGQHCRKARGHQQEAQRELDHVIYASEETVVELIVHAYVVFGSTVHGHVPFGEEAHIRIEE